MQSSEYTDLRRQLRRNATKAEQLIWPHLKEFRWKGYPVRRQYSVDSYIVDFYCPKARLAIEIDGDIHLTEYQKEYDKERDYYISTHEIEIIRFSNDQVFHDVEEVLEIIEQKILSNLKSLPPGQGGKGFRDEGCPPSNSPL
jgi:very-short-patch-repair endonuclease